MSGNFNKYLRNLSVISVTALTLVGAGCSGSAPAVAEPTTPDVTVNEPPITPVVPADKPADTTPAVATSVYKDGTYSADGAYVSPGGKEYIGITLTLKDDVIVDASATTHSTNEKTEFYQGRFASGFKALIVGKKISDVNLTVVSGSSLTPIGFKDALAQIATEAKA